jgi:hypothetical protein
MRPNACTTTYSAMRWTHRIRPMTPTVDRGTIDVQEIGVATIDTPKDRVNAARVMHVFDMVLAAGRNLADIWGATTIPPKESNTTFRSGGRKAMFPDATTILQTLTLRTTSRSSRRSGSARSRDPSCCPGRTV